MASNILRSIAAYYPYQSRFLYSSSSSIVPSYAFLRTYCKGYQSNHRLQVSLPFSSSTRHPSNIMKLSSQLIAVLSLSTSSNVPAFQLSKKKLPSRNYAQKHINYGHSILQLQQRSYLSSSIHQLRSAPAESVAELDIPTDLTKSTNINENTITEAEGKVLSYQTLPTTSASFAVVKLIEEELYIPQTLTAVGVGVAGDNDNGSVPLINSPDESYESLGLKNNQDINPDESDKVELANALFGKSTPAKNDLGIQQKKKGAMADGDLTGRTVTFSNSATGLVVAHRHPIAFVLIDSDSSLNDDDATDTECTVSTKLVSINPSSIPNGSVVDYLGRHVSVLNDGSVGRSLPKASSSSSSGIDGISLSIDTNNMNTPPADSNERPIFVQIPKISDIGLIDSPLVTGITAIDALTPIGKGQNMLVIGEEDKETDGQSSGGVNKRKWMINLMRNVVNNYKHKVESSVSSDEEKSIRCFYGLTSGKNEVRSSVLNNVKEAGIQDDIVTVVSNHDSSTSQDGDVEIGATMEASEAVAVAAATCTLGEHHALTTGGDSVVIIDDINLHKSLWDITTRELVKVYGVNSVVEADLQGGSSSEMRGFFSSLIQRAARFKANKGGGSVTLVLLSTLPNPKEEEDNSDEDEVTFEASDFDGMADKIKMRIDMLIKAKVPLTPTNLRKINLPVPKPSETENTKRLAIQHVEDLISMSDGQVWLDEALAQQGRSPPLDPSRSMTRVGIGADTRNCRADAPALRSVVGSLRFEFQQALDIMDSSLSTFTLPGASLEGDVRQVQRRDAYLLAMNQRTDETKKLSEECVALLAASQGYLDGQTIMGGLMAHVEKEAPEIIESIDTTLDLSQEERNTLEGAIKGYFA